MSKLCIAKQYFFKDADPSTAFSQLPLKLSQLLQKHDQLPFDLPPRLSQRVHDKFAEITQITEINFPWLNLPPIHLPEDFLEGRLFCRKIFWPQGYVAQECMYFPIG